MFRVCCGCCVVVRAQLGAVAAAAVVPGLVPVVVVAVVVSSGRFRLGTPGMLWGGQFQVEAGEEQTAEWLSLASSDPTPTVGNGKKNNNDDVVNMSTT